MDGDILKDNYSLSPVDSEPYILNPNINRLEQEFEREIPTNIHNRNSKCINILVIS